MGGTSPPPGVVIPALRSSSPSSTWAKCMAEDKEAGVNSKAPPPGSGIVDPPVTTVPGNGRVDGDRRGGLCEEPFSVAVWLERERRDAGERPRAPRRRGESARAARPFFERSCEGERRSRRIRSRPPPFLRRSREEEVEEELPEVEGMAKARRGRAWDKK